MKSIRGSSSSIVVVENRGRESGWRVCCCQLMKLLIFSVFLLVAPSANFRGLFGGLTYLSTLGAQANCPA